MSKLNNQLQCDWKSIESQIRGGLSGIKYQCKPLGPQSGIVGDAFMQLWLLWDGSVVSYSGTNIREFTRWWTRVQQIGDLAEILSILKASADLLALNFENSLGLDYDGFKRRLKEDHPMVGVLLSPIKGVIAGALGHDPIAFRYAYTDLRFLRKLNLVSEELEQEALEAYLSVEEHMGKPQTLEEKEFITRYFPKSYSSTLYGNMSPHHGNGSTSDAGSDIMAKYHSLGTSSKIHFLCNQSGGTLKEWSSQGYTALSKTIFVPKTFDSYRTIGMEPATHMWYQEGLNDAIVHRIHETDLRRRFDPAKQEPNREAARLGSQDETDESLCTIDLSAASDSVSLEHVKTWFSDSCLYIPLMCTRTKATVLPNGEILEMKKFAPMGSAVNFAVESLVFMAITESAIRQQGGRVSESRYRVYGDDIVVEKKYFSAVCQRLEQNGFKVNSSKSFSGTGPVQFRESCGAFYLNGIDVSPIQISRRFTGYRGRKSSWVPAAIDLANSCYNRPEARYLRQWIIKKLITLPSPIRPAFCGLDEDWGIRTEYPTNYHLEKIFDENLQEWMLSCGLTYVRTGQYDEEEDGPFLLYEWLRQAEVQRPSPTRSTRMKGIPLPVLEIDQVISKPNPILGSSNRTSEKRGIRWANRSLIWFSAGE